MREDPKLLFDAMQAIAARASESAADAGQVGGLTTYADWQNMAAEAGPWHRQSLTGDAAVLPTSEAEHRGDVAVSRPSTAMAVKVPLIHSPGIDCPSDQTEAGIRHRVSASVQRADSTLTTFDVREIEQATSTPDVRRTTPLTARSDEVRARPRPPAMTDTPGLAAKVMPTDSGGDEPVPMPRPPVSVAPPQVSAESALARPAAPNDDQAEVQKLPPDQAVPPKVNRSEPPWPAPFHAGGRKYVSGLPEEIEPAERNSRGAN